MFFKVQLIFQFQKHKCHISESAVGQKQQLEHVVSYTTSQHKSFSSACNDLALWAQVAGFNEYIYDWYNCPKMELGILKLSLKCTV